MSTAEITYIAGGAITSTPGFLAAGVASGLKPAGALDLALIHSPRACVGAAVFTTNLFKAAPVVYDRAAIDRNPAGLHTVVINSGCANACTGEQGLRDAKDTAATAARELGVAPDDVLLMSTGVIGKLLPMDKLLPGVQQAVAQLADTMDAGHAAARAIMTTDTRPKEVAVRVRTPEAEFTISGMVKGAGMIAPNMATLLSLVTTDAVISTAAAHSALSKAVEQSFNRITVDGDMSTNDTLLLLANGTVVMPAIESDASPLYQPFLEGLCWITRHLAQAVVRDGEGATRFMEITVRGARNEAEAKQVAMSVARSPLVKTAIYGQDANWGRIVCAVGYSGVDLDPERVSVWLGDLHLVRDGAPYEIDEERASVILARDEIDITIDLKSGTAEAVVWTCDLSHEYVDINAHYRT